MKDNVKKVDSAQMEQDLEELLDKWSRTLPDEFTLGTVGNGSRPGVHHQYPDLHFKADGEIPGLYYADLDPNFLSPKSKGNGHVEFTNEEAETTRELPK